MNLVCSYWVGTGDIEIGSGAFRRGPDFLFFNISAHNSRIGFPGFYASWCCAGSLKLEVF